MTAATTGEVILYYRQASTLCDQLVILTELIRRLAQKGNLKQLLVKIEKRKDIIRDLNTVHQRLRAHKTTSISGEICSINQEKEIIESFTENSVKTLHKIKTLDAEIEEILSKQRNRVHHQLKGISSRHHLVKRYTPGRGTTPKYFSLSA